jgi:hypothetical protein
MLRGTIIPPGLHEYTDGYQITMWQTMAEEVKANRSTGVCIGAQHPNSENHEVRPDALDNSGAHPHGYFCHYAMAWNKDGTLAKHWVTYFDKISTRLSKGLEKCIKPRKVKEKHPVRRTPKDT